mmetsp:Transcript_72698/g.168450  ORF Transcript_72698/g.168450 Transcript_72698/m.168450 type:complete len:705 (-) Transcript_72698:57-2171(-)
MAHGHGWRAAPLSLLALTTLLGPGTGAVRLHSSGGDAHCLLQHASEVRTQAQVRGEDLVRITVRNERGKELHLEARKTTRLGKLIDVVCKRLDLEKEYAKFTKHGRVLSQYDTVDEFGLEDQDVIDVVGGRVHMSHAKRSEASRQSAADAAQQAEAAVAAAMQSTTVAPTAAPVYEVGDFVYVNISQGEDSVNPWAPCSITGKGSESNTYNIHFIFAQQGQRDAPNVPVSLLRKVDGRRYAEAVQFYREDTEAAEQAGAFALARQALEAAKLAQNQSAANATDNSTHEGTQPTAEPLPQEFEVGDFMEIRLENNLSNLSSGWVPCRLLGKGQRNGTYQVHFLFGPPGHLDLTNISKDYLRKVNAREFAERSRDVKRIPQFAQEAVLQLEQEATNRREAEERALAAERARIAAEEAARKAAQEAEKRERERAKKQAEDQKAKEFAEKKAKRDAVLSKRKADELVEKQAAQTVYQDGALVELKMDKKVVKGTGWIPGIVVRKGTDDYSYDVHMEYGPPDREDITSVPAAYLRACSADHYANLLSRFTNDPGSAKLALEQVDREAKRRARALIAGRMAAANEPAPVIRPRGPLTVNDAVEIKIDKAVKGSTWIPCRITSAGVKRDTFNVRFDFSVPKHNADMMNIPSDLLRKANTEEFAQSMQQLKADAEFAEMAMVQVEREAGRRQRKEEEARRKYLEAKAAAAKA